MKKMFFAAILLMLISALSFAQGSGNASRADSKPSAKAFVPPAMTLAQISSMTAPANGTIVFCTTNEKFYAYLAGAKTWKELSYGSGTIASCGTPFTVSHVAGPVAPVTKPVTYGTVNNVPGEPSKCWITSNLGSDHQSASSGDETEPSAGWYWQFNRRQGFKNDGTEETPKIAWINSISETSDWTRANDPCAIELGSGWRIPTSTEWKNVNAGGSWTDLNSAWKSQLKLHAAGSLDRSDGSLYTRGSAGNYWSSTQNSASDGWSFTINSISSVVGYSDKTSGFSLRCLKD